MSKHKYEFYTFLQAEAELYHRAFLSNCTGEVGIDRNEMGMYYVWGDDYE